MKKGMFKVVGLIVVGTFLVGLGLHFLLNSGLLLQFLQLPSVNWGVAGLVALVGGAAVFGSAFAVSRLNK